MTNNEIMMITMIIHDYSEWLSKNGYIDDDWWAEEPTSINRYLEHLKKFENYLKDYSGDKL